MRRSWGGRSSSGEESHQVNPRCSSYTSLSVTRCTSSTLLMCWTGLIACCFLFTRMPAANQMVSVSAASRPPVLRGHLQPLVDAEHVLLCSTVLGADREPDHRNQTAQHRPRALSLHTHPRGRGSMIRARTVTIGLFWSELDCTDTKDLKQSGEERWPPTPQSKVYATAHIWQFRPGGSDPLHCHDPNYLSFPAISVMTSSSLDADLGTGRPWVCRRACSGHTCFEQTHTCVAVVLNGKRTELHKLSLHRSLPRDHSKEGKAKTLVKRSLTLVFFVFSKKSAFCEIVGGVGAWKYLNLWSKKAFHQWPFCSLRSTRLYSVYCCHCFSSRGPRSVKPMPFITTTITISTTPMSLATRQPHSSGSNLCKQIIKKLDLPHSLLQHPPLFYNLFFLLLLVLYTNTRLRQPLIQTHLNAHHNAKPYRDITSSALQFFFL